MPRPDLIITGCVAVNKDGWRLGKGGGYGDKEIKTFLEKFGKIPVVTTVHDLQIVEEVPHDKLDTRSIILLLQIKSLSAKSMDLTKLQKEIYQNKVNRGFNVTDVGKEIILMTEELGELARAYKNSNKNSIKNPLKR